MNSEELTKIVSDAVDPIMEKRQIDKISALEAEVANLKVILKAVIHELRTTYAQVVYNYDHTEVTDVDLQIDRSALYDLEIKL